MVRRLEEVDHDHTHLSAEKVSDEERVENV